MAGVSTDFDTEEVRGNLRAVMLMGLPQDAGQRPVFHFPDRPIYAKHDMAGAPWDFNETKIPPADPPKPDVTCGDADGQIVCTWTILGRQTQPGQQAPMGTMNRERLEFTFLDVDYAIVRGFTTVTVGFSVYKYDKTLPHDGLHDLEVITVIVQAEDVL